MQSGEQLTDQELSLAKQVFDEFDSNNNGELTKVEILQGIMSNNAVRNLLESHEIFSVLLDPSKYASRLIVLTSKNGFMQQVNL